jgi:predicted ArsR family transcriptional regulator
MAQRTISAARRRVLELLKRLGEATAPELAGRLEMTDVAARQHLAQLESTGLVRQRQAPPRGRGRPAILWSLTDEAAAVFPDSHAELTVGLIDAIRETVGERGLKRIVEVRARDQVNFYDTILPPASASLKRRVEALARQRTAEGYMAEVITEKPGVYVLIEHHCPICEAARSCTGLCSAELDVFQRALGEDVRIERTKHVLSGDDRCAYRITRA